LSDWIRSEKPLLIVALGHGPRRPHAKPNGSRGATNALPRSSSQCPAGAAQPSPTSAARICTAACPMAPEQKQSYSGPVMGTLRHCLLYVVWGATAACGGNSYATAAGATAVTVAATGVHRALTHDCWGRCSAGYACNEHSGFCEPGECDPACPAGYSCAVTPTSNECRPDPAPLFNSTTGTVSVPGGATPAVLPSDPVAPGRAAPGLTPDRATSGQVQIQRGNPGPRPEPQPSPTSSPKSNH